jgi:hypothetical protein
MWGKYCKITRICNKKKKAKNSAMFEIFSSALAYRFFDLFVGCGVFSLCNLLLSPFLYLNCFTNTLEYYPKNYCFRLKLSNSGLELNGWLKVRVTDVTA